MIRMDAAEEAAKAAEQAAEHPDDMTLAALALVAEAWLEATLKLGPVVSG